MLKRFEVKDEDFKKSKKSGNWGGVPVCVEVAMKPEGVAVRNSQDPSKNTVFFSREEWGAFIEGVKDNEFNL